MSKTDTRLVLELCLQLNTEQGNNIKYSLREQWTRKCLIMKTKRYYLLIPMLAALLMALSLVYSKSVPSIPEIRVTYRGFPLEWLKIVIYILPEAPMNVEIIPFGFVVDLVSYFLLSCIIVYRVTRTKHQCLSISISYLSS